MGLYDDKYLELGLKKDDIQSVKQTLVDNNLNLVITTWGGKTFTTTVENVASKTEVTAINNQLTQMSTLIQNVENNLSTKVDNNSFQTLVTQVEENNKIIQETQVKVENQSSQITNLSTNAIQSIKINNGDVKVTVANKEASFDLPMASSEGAGMVKLGEEFSVNPDNQILGITQIPIDKIQQNENENITLNGGSASSNV